MNNNLSKRKKIFGRNTFMYILLLPAIILTVVFCYLPMAGLVLAFKNFDAISGFAGSPWVGLENFKAVLTIPDFLNSIKNTFIFSSALVFGQFPFPVILALLFNELKNKTFKRTVQTVTYFPHFLSMAAVCGLIYTLFAMEGPVNSLLSAIMGEDYVKTNIMMDSKNFLSVMFGTSLWQNVGWNTIIYLAAIAGIDSSLYEAAIVDGAGKLRQAIYITIPALFETMILLLILSMGSLVNTSFELVYGLQNVYTQAETEVISTIVYRQGIQSGEFSKATALGLMQSLVSFALVITANKLSKKVSNVGLW